MNVSGTKDSSDAKYTKIIKKIGKLPYSIWNNLWKLGKDDPRRAVHAVKMGLALTLVSLLYLLGPLSSVFGSNAMWAIITVVLILEFTVGATLCKGFNRGLGTMCAGMLALLVNFFAEKTGRISKIVIIGVSVFLVGTGATFVRFVPHIKKNYDYGVIIFLLTFNLITLSTFNVVDIFGMARDRLYTIVGGSAIGLSMCILVLPNWSGQDLEKSTVDKLEALAKSIEACVNDYFEDLEVRDEEKLSRYPIYKGYKMVLDSKTSDETQALFASWEPRHSRHQYPWQQYVDLGTTLRHFAYTAVALHGCLESAIQAPQSLRSQFKDPCIRLAAEVSKVLNQLAADIKNHRRSPPSVLSDHLHNALQDLNSAIKYQPRLFLGPTNNLPSPKQPETLLNLKSRRVEDQSKDSSGQRILRHQLSTIVINTLEFSDALPLAAFSSLLVEMVARLDLVIDEVEVLGKAAHFKKHAKKVMSRKRSPKFPGRVVPHIADET